MYLNEGGAEIIWQEEHQVPYGVQDTTWIGFDSSRSLTGKVTTSALASCFSELTLDLVVCCVQVEWMMAEGFAGWMVWNFDLDDFNAQHCGEGAYPLINVMNDALTGAPPTTTTSTSAPSTTTSGGASTTTTNGGGMPPYDGLLSAVPPQYIY